MLRLMTADRWPPRNRTKSPTNVMVFMQKFQLVYIWKKKNPNTKSKLAPVDHVLPTPLTDHKTINLQINLKPNASITYRNSYWKLNNSVLKHKVVVENIHILITFYWHRVLTEKCFLNNCELFKFEVAKYLREYGSSLAKLRKEEETKVIARIATLTQCMPEDLTEDDKQELIEQQLRLDEMYRV